jgi:hypothetical protein
VVFRNLKLLDLDQEEEQEEQEDLEILTKDNTNLRLGKPLLLVEELQRV